MMPPWAEVRRGDSRGALGETFDAVLVNAGVTHVEREWLDALAPGGRMVVPLTVALPASATAAHPAGRAMANIGKGVMVLITREADAARVDARMLTFVAIYSAIELRDETANADLARAMARLPMAPLKSLRFDAHEADATCWCHTALGCWSMA